MSKKPTATGRIESPKKQGFLAKAGIILHNSLFILVPLALVAAGIFATLKYQEFIDNTKAQGVSEYQSIYCDEFTNKDKTEKWLECDVQ